MANPTINQLQDELVERVKSTTTFADSGFKAFNLDDLSTWREAGAALPMAGISYEGSDIPASETNTNRNSRGSRSVNIFNVRFSVIIGIDYRGAGGPDTKVTALSLLQEVRDVLHGYRGVNTRPWTFLTEQPLDGSDIEGVVFFGQLWMTDIILTGNHTEQ